MAENFANFDEEWIQRVGKRWEKNGRIRYYFDSVKPVFDLLGIKYSTYKSGGFSKVEGYSNNKAFALNRSFSNTYFDAGSGKFVGNSSIQSDLEKALISSKSARVARENVSASLKGKSGKSSGAGGGGERG